MASRTESAPFPQVGGHPALDLIDTVHWRLDDARAIDTLADYGDVVAWCVQLGFVSAEEGARLDALAARDPRAASGEHDRIIALREAVYATVFTDDDRSAEIARAYAEGVGRGVLERAADTTTWRWQPALTLAAPRDHVASLVNELLVRADLDRVRQCDDDACGWVYLDTSPRRNRRWCTAAGCGNRNRVAKHYRSRSAP